MKTSDLNTPYAATAVWSGSFDERAFEVWVRELRGSFQAYRPTLGLVFLTPRLFSQAAQILELVRLHAQVPWLIGCSSAALIAGDHEWESGADLVLGLYALPDARLKAIHFAQEDVEAVTDATHWPARAGIDGAEVNSWLVFADPYNLDAETWLQQWNAAWPQRPIVGGLASGDPVAARTQVYLNGEVHEAGGVALALGGKVTLHPVISQGCTPIGESWTITRAEQNIIHQIANRPAYALLADTFNQLPPADQARTRGNLLVGLVVDEYREEFRRGDFLIRNLLGGDPASGALAVGALPRLGQTLQFQRRDAAAADEDLHALLTQAHAELGGRRLYGACLCCCNGRGERLFGQAHHDAAAVQRLLGPVGLTGFFCNGEIGPVGPKNFLHGYTASLGLFVSTKH